MNGLREYIGALMTGLLAARERPRHLILICVGFCIASTTLLIMLTLPAGMKRLAGHTGNNDVVVVLPNRSVDEGDKQFTVRQLQILKTLPDVGRDKRGQVLVAPQFVAYAKLRETNGKMGTVLIRGITTQFYEINKKAFKVINGHLPRVGHNEFIAGEDAAAKYVALKSGDQDKINGVYLRSVGLFRAEGSFWNSEIWVSRDVLQSLYNAPGSITSIWIKLDNPTDYSVFVKALKGNKLLSGVSVERQTAFYAKQTKFLGYYIRIATLSIAIVLGLGAILAISNSLGIALEARQHELAIMRAIGYSGGPLALALFTEVLLIATVCVGIIATLALIFWSGHSVNSATLFQSIRFEVDVSQSVILITLGYALLIGTIGSLVPIRRVIKVPLVNALNKL